MQAVFDLALGPLDGDDRDDIVITTYDQEQILVITSAGDTEFSSASIINTPGFEFREVSIADLNGDGALDFAVVNSTDVVLFRNDGSANFTESMLLQQDDYIRVLYLKDYDQDGDVDLLTNTNFGVNLSVNEGNLNFTSGEQSSELSGSIRDINMDDFNDDGLLDILYVSSGGGRVGWMQADGEGGFLPAVLFADDAGTLHSITSADFDQDGYPDALYGSYRNLFLHRGGIDGVFSSAEDILELAGGLLGDVLCMDMDEDGDLDIVYCYDDYNDEMEVRIAWIENEGNQFRRIHQLSRAQDGVRQLVARDIDLDGDQDLLFASIELDYVAWYQNNNAGDFAEEQILVENVRHSFAVDDTNGDGAPDLLVVDEETGELRWLAGDGTGNFQNPVFITLTSFLRDPLAIDFDFDGDLDLLLTNYDEDLVTLLRNDGDGNFDEGLNLITGFNTPKGVKAADFDQDGDLDIVVGSAADDETRLYVNDGLLNFTVHQLITQLEHPDEFHISDIDFDGDLDIVARFYGDRAAWFVNDGIGNFELGSIISSDDTIKAASCLDDVNGDGALDLVVAYIYFDDQMIVWHENSFVAPSIGGQASNVSCNDNDTAEDPLDDYIELDLEIIGSDLSGQYVLSVSGGSIDPESGFYGSIVSCVLPEGSAGAGDLSITATDSENPNFSVVIPIADPGECSEPTSTSGPGELQLTVSPNPTDGQLLFQVADNNPGLTLLIRNSLGQLIFEQAFEDASIHFDAGNLAAGVYHYELRSANTKQLSGGSFILNR